jgi:hypothetical protein
MTPDRGSLDGAGQGADGPVWPAAERESDERRNIHRPLPVVAPSAFLRVKFALPACGRIRRVGRTSCARSYRVSRL